MKIKVALFYAIFYIGIFLGAAEVHAISCQLPEVLYNGFCTNSTRTCTSSPQYSIPGTCIDAIENGIFVEKAYFNCLPGYVRQNSMCMNPCPSPQIPFEGRCSDPFPVCLNPPVNSVVSTCRDAIINSVRIERFEFQCLSGYKKILNECTNPCSSPQILFNDVCTNPVSACQNPPANAVTSTCVDKIENNQRIERHDFTCMDGYKKQDKECVSVCDAGKVDFGGQCLSAYSPCQIWPLNAANCVDKIEQGIRKEQYDFICLPGFEKEGRQCIRKTDCPSPTIKSNGTCVDPIISCLNIPSHALQISCVDTLSENGRTENYSFACESGFSRHKRTCISENEWTGLRKSADEFFLAPIGYDNPLISNETTSITNPFADTNISTLEGKAAAELYYRGVVRGYPDGLFRGQQPINRAETAKLLLLARFNSIGSGSLTAKFTDVDSAAWFAKYVGIASQYGIIDGYPNQSFKPATTVNTAEFMKMISKTFELSEGTVNSYTDISPNDWFFTYAGAAQKYQLLPNRKSILQPASLLTRNEVAVAIYQYLRNR